FEIFVFALFFVTIITLNFKQNTLSSRLPNIVFVLSALSITTAYINSSPAPQRVPAEHIFSFHPDTNTFVLVLDTLQSDFFDEALREQPEEFEFLNDFTFYRNAIAGYPTTAPNLPAIFSGKRYRNQVEFREFLDQTYKERTLLTDYQDAGYLTSIVTISPQVAPHGIALSRSVQQGSYFRNMSLAQFIDFGLFPSV